MQGAAGNLMTHPVAVLSLNALEADAAVVAAVRTFMDSLAGDTLTLSCTTLVRRTSSACWIIALQRSQPAFFVREGMRRSVIFCQTILHML